MGKRKQSHLSRNTTTWWQTASVLLVGLLAHGGCLDSTFYLDDWWHIFENVHVEGGRWYEIKNLLLTNLSYFLTWKFFGFSLFWFHLFNLLLHLAGSIAIFHLGRHLLEMWKKDGQGYPLDTRTIAWIAALIFAAHPLLSEVTNYARGRDHGMVGFFTFFATCFTALGIYKNWKWFLAVLLSVGLASVSKGPGLPQSLLNVAIVLLSCASLAKIKSLFTSHKWKVYSSILIAEGSYFVFKDMFENLLFALWNFAFNDSRFFWHIVTQCRIFWYYVRRMVWPTDLCSDHFIAWTTNFHDTEAWFACAGVLLLLGFIAWLWWKRKQPWALLATLAIGIFALRCLYITELMVEYRVYPAMPYIAMIAALGIAHAWKRLPVLTVSLSTATLGLLVFLSFLRSEDWSTSGNLYRNILDQYPLQLRVYNCMSENDARAGNWQAILDRHEEFYQKLRLLIAENQKPGTSRYYENWSAYAACEDCMVSEALLETKGPKAAREFHMKLLRLMQRNHVHLGVVAIMSEWDFVMGKIELASGNKAKALVHFHNAYPASIYPLRVKAELKKLGYEPRNNN